MPHMKEKCIIKDLHTPKHQTMQNWIYFAMKFCTLQGRWGVNILPLPKKGMTQKVGEQLL